MDKAILLAVAASFCMATASLCQRKGARSTQTAGFDVRLIVRLASPSGGRLHAPGSSWLLAGLVTSGAVVPA